MEQNWPAYEAKMKAEGCNDAAIKAFKYNYSVLVSGESVMIPESSLTPVESLPNYASIEGEGDPKLLKSTVMLKLNGGLGTGMGLEKAKSLLEVTNGNAFLDLIAKQIKAMKSKYATDLAFMLMNSFSTSDDTKAFFAKYEADLGKPEDMEFVQNKAPK